MKESVNMDGVSLCRERAAENRAVPVVLFPEGGVGASIPILAVADHLGILCPWLLLHWGGRWACPDLGV